MIYSNTIDREYFVLKKYFDLENVVFNFLMADDPSHIRLYRQTYFNFHAWLALATKL